MKKLIALLVVIGALVFGVNSAWGYYNSSLDTPASSQSQKVTFHVDAGESPSAIAEDLHAKGLIVNTTTFEFYVRLNGLGPSFQAGDFVLDKHMTPRQIADALQHASSKEVAFTIPEGYTLKRIAAKWESAGMGKAQDYIDAANPANWQSYDFIQQRPKVSGRQDGLEGYLFPDTYELPENATAKDLVKAQLDRFQQIVQPFRGPIQQQGKTIDQIVIMASMVDREVQTNPNRAIVCGVMYNRIDIHNSLDVDATVLYALGKTTGPQTVTNDDLAQAANSPYDTYTHQGPPPGPISNPGKDAIDACVNPQQRDKHYLFYFAGCDGQTHFATSEADFETQEARYGVVGGKC